jgi:hypothetical protein
MKREGVIKSTSEEGVARRRAKRRSRARATDDRPERTEDVTEVLAVPERPASGKEGIYRIGAALAAIAVAVFFFVRGAPKPMLIAAGVAVIAIICLDIYERSKGR